MTRPSESSSSAAAPGRVAGHWGWWGEEATTGIQLKRAAWKHDKQMLMLLIISLFQGPLPPVTAAAAMTAPPRRPLPTAHDNGAAPPHARELPAVATCNTCGESKPASEYYHSSLGRSFYFCRACCSAATKLRRRTQPAYKLLNRARGLERRRGTPLQGLSVRRVNRLLAEVDPALVEADCVRLVRRNPDEPLGENNVSVLILERGA